MKLKNTIPEIIAKMSDDAKLKFEQERDEILKSLPDEVKGMFGTIGFCPGEEEDDLCDDDDDGDGGEEDSKKKSTTSEPYFQPVLIVSPWDVPPKPVRDIYWMDAYTKAKRSKAKLKQLDYLVYVYGSDDPDDCYNFVKQTDFISLVDAQKKGYNKLPKFIATKTELERTEYETRLIRGLDEMKTDIPKESVDRKWGNPFLERHEKITSSSNSSSSSDGPPSKKQKK